MALPRSESQQSLHRVTSNPHLLQQQQLLHHQQQQLQHPSFVVKTDVLHPPPIHQQQPGLHPPSIAVGATAMHGGGGGHALPHSSSSPHLHQAPALVHPPPPAPAPHLQMNTLPQAFEKKLRRLEKNRESARECRRRKKEHVLELQKQVAHLEAENLKLKLQLKVGEESQAQERQEKERITKKLDEMVKSGASEADIWQTIDMFKERYSDYGSDRRSAIEFHVTQLDKLLLPTKLTKLCMWMLLHIYGGASASPQGDGGAGGGAAAEGKAATIAQELWTVISKELEVTEDQQRLLLAQRETVAAMDTDLNVTLGMLGELRGMIDDKNSSLDQELLEIQKILTPTQTAKFILWITQNPACMHMLNHLWRFIYEKPASSSAVGGGGEGDEYGNKMMMSSSSPSGPLAAKGESGGSASSL